MINQKPKGFEEIVLLRMLRENKARVDRLYVIPLLRMAQKPKGVDIKRDDKLLQISSLLNDIRVNGGENKWVFKEDNQ